ncbi:MAG: hypothetical protein KME64_00850 [Scytonematopsis contorta HA4267-MV1]|nr:hypothetical protein [Scytonematopsis contorta HA4267-MV1]
MLTSNGTRALRTAELSQKEANSKETEKARGKNQNQTRENCSIRTAQGMQRFSSSLIIGCKFLFHRLQQTKSMNHCWSL